MSCVLELVKVLAWPVALIISVVIVLHTPRKDRDGR